MAEYTCCGMKFASEEAYRAHRAQVHGEAQPGRHMVFITARVKPGRAREALDLFKTMHPAIKENTTGLSRSFFFQSVEDPDEVGCVCVWASRGDFLTASDNLVYQQTVTDYFAAPAFAESPTHTAFDVLFEAE